MSPHDSERVAPSFVIFGEKLLDHSQLLLADFAHQSHEALTSQPYIIKKSCVAAKVEKNESQTEKKKKTIQSKV